MYTYIPKILTMKGKLLKTHPISGRVIDEEDESIFKFDKILIYLHDKNKGSPNGGDSS